LQYPSPTSQLWLTQYDEHFSAISDIIPHTTPEDYL
jgi:hypothetical protein